MQKLSPVTFIEVEDAVVGCCRCMHAFHTKNGISKDLGDVSHYESIRKPVSGWITCSSCRKR